MMSYLSESPIKDEVSLAKAIIFRYGTSLLRYFSLDELIHEVRLGFWLAQQDAERRGRPNPGVGFYYRRGVWRLLNLRRWLAPALEVPLVPTLEGEEDGEVVAENRRQEAASPPPEITDLEAVISLIERLLDFHSRGQGRLNVRRWLLGRLLGETLAETAAAIGIPKSRLAAQVRAMRLYLAPYREDIAAVLRGDLEPNEVPLRPAPSRWRMYGAKKGHVACDICGKPARTLHHIQPRRWGGPDEKKNLVPLCEVCHGKLEVHYMRIERPGMTVAEWRRAYESWKKKGG